MTEIERDLGIAPGLLNKWRARQRADGKAAFPGSGHQAEAEAELRRLKRENDLLREERDILKKPSRSSRGKATSEVQVHQPTGQLLQGQDHVSRSGCQ